MLPHAPGVQMADIPPDGLGVPIKDDGEAADAADPDKRNPTAISDKQVEAENEFDESKSGNKDSASSKEEPMEVDGGAKPAATSDS